MTDARRTKPATYHALGTGGLFCRVCLCTIVPDLPTPDDPMGVRMHERANEFRHKEFARKGHDADRPRLD